MWVHTGYKPYLCKHCPKAYTNSNDLKHHERRHAGGANKVDKPHKCPSCDMRFYHPCRYAMLIFFCYYTETNQNYLLLDCRNICWRTRNHTPAMNAQKLSNHKRFSTSIYQVNMVRLYFLWMTLIYHQLRKKKFIFLGRCSNFDHLFYWTWVKNL